MSQLAIDNYRTSGEKPTISGLRRSLVVVYSMHYDSPRVRPIWLLTALLVSYSRPAKVANSHCRPQHSAPGPSVAQRRTA